MLNRTKVSNRKTLKNPAFASLQTWNDAVVKVERLTSLEFSSPTTKLFMSPSFPSFSKQFA